LAGSTIWIKESRLGPRRAIQPRSMNE